MVLREIKELKTGPRELRKFGLLVGAVFAILGLLFWIRGKAHYPWFLVPGVVLVLFGTTFSRALKPVYIVWMSLAIVLGFVVSNVLLIIFFFVVITPMGLAARLFGKDFLRLKLDRSASSYWIPRTATRGKLDYERQF
jgi:hypothetical protein